MPKDIFDPEVLRCLENAMHPRVKAVGVHGDTVQVPSPFPSPEDWRDCWIYFLMIDRFNNPDAPPKGEWNRVYDYRQGGTFNGVRAQLDYLHALGVNALWLSPVLRNAPSDTRYNYHGYGIQNFLCLDGRFASDGTCATAEVEFAALVDEAHARGMHIILDIVLSHTARVFDYLIDGEAKSILQDWNIMQASFGQEPHICWLDHTGAANTHWQDLLPPADTLEADDAVWPADLQRAEFFRRRGEKLSYDASNGFIRGDFADMRQLVVEYQATAPEQHALREKYGPRPVLEILIQCHAYLIAKFDIDGFRIDTAKHVDAHAIETFGNAIREYALSIGKKNFFTFGEIADNEYIISQFVGRNHAGDEGFGIDAALDFPLYHTLPHVATGERDVRELHKVFAERKQAQRGLISSHGEAGRYFVGFLDNHDQYRRFNNQMTDERQVIMGVAMLFCLQGIPCLYYGTEQGLQGAVDAQGQPDYNSAEAVREALWGKPDAFNTRHPLFQQIQRLAALRHGEPALRYGRLYFRRISQNGKDFGYSYGAGGIVAFSRILAGREVLLIANTGMSQSFQGQVLVDADLNRQPRTYALAHSNLGTQRAGEVQLIAAANLYDENVIVMTEDSAAIQVELAPMEVQIFTSHTLEADTVPLVCAEEAVVR
ncbi:MAG TPA: alpha-amylase family glycosyl hydrolase [Armatimonadota bacterium]|jgi:glycosidase